MLRGQIFQSAPVMASHRVLQNRSRGMRRVDPGVGIRDQCRPRVDCLSLEPIVQLKDVSRAVAIPPRDEVLIHGKKATRKAPIVGELAGVERAVDFGIIVCVEELGP